MHLPCGRRIRWPISTFIVLLVVWTLVIEVVSAHLPREKDPRDAVTNESGHGRSSPRHFVAPSRLLRSHFLHIGHWSVSNSANSSVSFDHRSGFFVLDFFVYPSFIAGSENYTKLFRSTLNSTKTSFVSGALLFYRQQKPFLSTMLLGPSLAEYDVEGAFSSETGEMVLMASGTSLGSSITAGLVRRLVTGDLTLFELQERGDEMGAGESVDAIRFNKERVDVMLTNVQKAVTDWRVAVRRDEGNRAAQFLDAALGIVSKEEAETGSARRKDAVPTLDDSSRTCHVIFRLAVDTEDGSDEGDFLSLSTLGRSLWSGRGESGDCDMVVALSSMTSLLHGHWDLIAIYFFVAFTAAMFENVLCVYQLHVVRANRLGADECSWLFIFANVVYNWLFSSVHLLFPLGMILREYDGAIWVFLLFLLIALLAHQNASVWLLPVRRLPSTNDREGWRREWQQFTKGRRTRFPIYVLIFVFLPFALMWFGFWRLLLFSLYSFWVPQIARNAARDTAYPFVRLFIPLVSMARLMVPCMLLTIPLVPPSRDRLSIIGLILVVILQAVVLYLQDPERGLGPQWFLPRFLRPTPFHYDRIPKTEHPPPSIECPICFGPIHLPQESAAESNIPERPATCVKALRCDEEAGIDLPINAHVFWRTPCNHYFHKRCLEEWMKYKLECPVDRRPLPIARRGRR